MAFATFSTRAAPLPAQTRWLAALIVFAIALAYANCVRTPFLFDDAGAVVDNPTIRRLASIDVLRPPADGSTTTGRPVANLSFAFDYAVSGAEPWGYHLGNIGIHAATALLLFGLVRRTLLGPQLVQRSEPFAMTVGFFVALLWALHPLQTESVVCIAQRTEILCGFFFLLTLYGFTRATCMGGLEPTWCRAWLVVSFGACLAGMATKEVMVAAPLVVLVFDRTFFAGTFSAAWRSRGKYYLALAATWFLLGLLLVPGSGARGVAAGFGLGVSSWSYLLTQCEALVHYLQLAAWPHPLVLDYGTAVVRSATEVWWQGLLVLALFTSTVWALIRRPVLGFLGVWFFVVLAPSSSFVPLVTQTMAEHRMYLPLAALVTGVVIGFQMLVRSRAKLGLTAIALALGLATVGRNRDYHDAYSIWSTTVADYPQSARAHNNLAFVLEQRGDHVRAFAHFSRAVELDPAYATAHYNWGAALLGDRRFEEAVAHFESALRLAPRHVDALVNLGNALVQLNRSDDAIARYEQALQLKPAADVHYNLGVVLSEARRDGAAVKHFQSALQLNPRLSEAWVQLGRLSEQERRTAEAETHYLAALQITPEHAVAHARLGLLYARNDRLEEASRHLREAVRLTPNDADVLANLGNVLLLQGKAREALVHYEEALRLRPDDARLRQSIREARESLR